MLVGVGHAIWGLIVYHYPVWDLIRAGFVGSVGDGIFDITDAKGPRAAAFWFLLAAPLLVLGGYLVEVAIRARITMRCSWPESVCERGQGHTEDPERRRQPPSRRARPVLRFRRCRGGARVPDLWQSVAPRPGARSNAALRR